jgi:hypothetical protein
MSCILNLLNNSLLGEDPNGTLQFLYFDIDCDGIEDNGGSLIFIGSNGDVNFDSAIAGCYWFKYSGGLPPDCYQEIIFPVRVVEQPNAGTGTTAMPCAGDAVINLFSLLGGSPQLTGTWSGNGTLSPDYSDGGTPADPTDDTFDPTTEGIYSFTYTVTQVAPVGYTLHDCPNCEQSSTVVTIHVIDCTPPPPDCDSGESASVQVCSATGCSFDLYDQLGGNPDAGGSWAWQSGPQVILPTGGDQGTVSFLNAQIGSYQFSYTVGSCVSVVTVHVVASPNAGCNGTRQLCETSGAVSLFPNLGCSPNSGGTWTISPALPNGTFTNQGVINPALGDEGVYTATYTVSNPVTGPCGSVCVDTATVTVTILEHCNAGNNVTVVLCQDDSIVLNPAVLLGATSVGGTWFCAGQSLSCNGIYGAALFSVNGGVQQDWQGDNIPNGATLDNFANLGCISLQYFCQSTPPGCNDFATLTLQIVNCPPACTASVSISAVACNLSSSISGTCPTPTYQWQVLSGSLFIPAPGDNDNPTYLGLNGSTYRLRVTGCTGCNELFSTPITVSCPPPPSCSITCSLIYNVPLGRFEATITNSGAATCQVPYQFNRHNTNHANCLLCSGGVQSAACAGNVTVPPSGSVQVNCVSPQSGVEECWRFVTLASCCNQTLCCTKKPAAASLCWQLPPLDSFTDITQLIVNTGGGDVNIMGAAQFNCTEYESTEPQGTMNGIVNCSLAQLVIDINQWLVANGHSGTAYITQVDKSSSIRVSNTNVTFVRVQSVLEGPIPFAASGCGGCDADSWHQQGLSTGNFPSIGVNGFLNPSIGGTINLFTMLDAYFGGAPVELPHNGTFTAALCITGTNGCVTVNTNCWSDCVPPPATPAVVVNNIIGGVPQADHGNFTWTPFVPNTGVGTQCFWQVRYFVALPNGCDECILISIKFNDAI